MSDLCEAMVTIVNELGLHARAATTFVQTASKYDAEVIVAKDGREVNGKSIMGILTLVAAKGSEICIRAEGREARQALAALSALVARRFGEDK